MLLPRVYPIVDVGTLLRQRIAVAQFARELVDGGAEILQLRDKDGSPQETLDRARQLSAVLDGTDCLPVMNDRVDLALLAGWHAVHLGHQDLPPAAARRVFGTTPLVVGTSTHTDEQVRAAEDAGVDYVAIGPVFRTATKPDAEPAVGLAGVRRARALTTKPLVAIGGIDRENAPAVIAAGADSVAVIGALLSAGESVSAVMRDFSRRLR